MRIICVISILLATTLAGLCEAANFPNYTSGPGIGIMYAGAGVNVEYHVNESFSVAGGINLFTSDLRWTAAGLYRPDANNRLRFSVGSTNSFDFFDGDDQHPIDLFMGIGWGPRRQEDYRGWNVDIIFGSSERSAMSHYNPLFAKYYDYLVHGRREVFATEEDIAFVKEAFAGKGIQDGRKKGSDPFSKKGSDPFSVI